MFADKACFAARRNAQNRNSQVPCFLNEAKRPGIKSIFLNAIPFALTWESKKQHWVTTSAGEFFAGAGQKPSCQHG